MSYYTSIKSLELELYATLNKYFPKVFDTVRSVLANTPDYELFAMSKDYDPIRLCRGDISIIFPNEPHAPCIRAVGGDSNVRSWLLKFGRHNKTRLLFRYFSKIFRASV